MKFALQDKLTGLHNYREIFQFAKETGFDGVEITNFGKKLDKEKAQLISTASEVTGIQPSAVCGGYRNWIGDFDKEKRLDAVSDIGISLKYTAEIGAEGLIAPAAYGVFSKRLPPFDPPRDEEDDREALIDSLLKIAEYAEKYDVNFFLEPLNRYEDHMINTVSQATLLINEVGSKKLKVMADFFHMSIEEDEIVQSIEEYFNSIGYYHLADSNRLQPGEGHTNFDKPLTRLQELNYKGFLSYECGIRGEGSTPFSESLAYLKSLYKIANT